MTVSTRPDPALRLVRRRYDLPPISHFSAMMRAVEDMRLTGVPVIPPERTYL